MKGLKRAFQELWGANIYDACNDEYVRNVKIDPDALIRSKYHTISFDKLKRRKVLLDPRAPDYEDIFIEKGNPMGPDDILEAVKPSALKIPVPSREDVPELPSSDLLKALHYYSSYTGLRNNSCDETALLSLGMLVEQWVDELVTDEYAAMFAEAGVADDELLPDDNKELKIEPHIERSDSEDSDLISLDLEHSDNEDLDANSDSFPAADSQSLFLQASSSSDSSDSDSDSSSSSSDSDSDSSSDASSDTSDKPGSTSDSPRPASSPTKPELQVKASDDESESSSSAESADEQSNTDSS